MPKILWMSPYSLHDTTSGASIHCRAMLENLAQKGFEIWAFSSFVFDRPQGGTTSFGDLKELYARQPNVNIFELNDHRIHYIYLKNTHTYEMERSCIEQMEYFYQFCEILDVFKPDIVLGFGTGMDSYTCFAEAKRQGCATVYMLLNGKHSHFSFPHIDLVLTDSQTTAELYRVRDHISAISCGHFMSPQEVVATERQPTFITMVTPEIEKGVAIFAKLVSVCEQEMPDQKFLVVNSRANFQQSASVLHDPNDKESFPLRGHSFKNLLMTNGAVDLRPVLANTKAIVVPSLAYESWSRIVSAAQLNDIPALGANVGAIPEAIGNAGIVLDPPQHCLEDPTSLPTDEEIKPWVEALKRLLQGKWTQQLNEAKLQLDAKRLTDNLTMHLLPLCQHFQPRFHRHGIRRP